MRVRFFAYLRDYTNCPETDVQDAPTVGDLARILGERYGAKFKNELITPSGEPGSEIVIMVNGRHVVHLGGLDAQLKDSDVVQIFPLVAGG